MGEMEDALDCRNAGLFRLRELDDELRSLMRDGDPFHDLLDERECICDALVVMNAEPWPFSVDSDESWLVGG